MFKYISFAALTMLISVNAGELPYNIKETSTLAENDFSEDNLKSKPWKVHYGKWSVENGVLSSTPIEKEEHSTSLSLFYKIPVNSMFSFDFTLAAEGKGLRVAFFGKGGCKLMIQQKEIFFLVNDKHDKDNPPVAIDWKKLNLEIGRKYHIDLIINGEKAVALLDGKAVLMGRHPIVATNKKRYQFSMANSKHSFDNFKLCEITQGNLPEDSFKKKHLNFEELGKLRKKDQETEKE